MRKKIIAANWKMNMTQSEAADFVATFLLELGESTEVEVVLVPPFTAIAAVNGALGQAQHVKVGAQNMHWERSGAFTGEISPAMLRDLFVRYVVLGHSERRTLFGETDEIVNRKVRAAHEAMLRPIVCVGETLEQRERGDVEKVLGTQLRGSLAGLDAKELHETVIAYEPVWAIGTGRTATAEQAQEAHAFHPPDARRNFRRGHGRQDSDSVRRQCKAGQRPHAHEPARHRWRARRRREPRSAQLRADRPGRAGEVGAAAL